MECNILQDLAGFDTNAPISVSISFEDSNEFEDIPIKTENITNDDNSQSIKLLPDIALKLETEIKQEPISIPEISGQVKLDEQIGQNILKEVAFCSSENSQSSNETRKRKQKQLQIYKNKRPTISVKESEPYNQSSHVSENACDNERSTPTSDDAQAEPSFLVESTPHLEPGTNSLKSSTETQAQTDKLSSYIKRCLSPVSEHMRLVMEAYQDHKHNKKPKESFIVMKKMLFSLSYSTAVTMLLPEEKNVEFLKTFLKETYRHACEAPSAYKSSYKDYETLLKELLWWTKRNKSHIEKVSLQKGNTVLKSATGDHVKSQELDISNLNSLSSNIEQNKSTKSTEICIFSAGPHGNEISINVDPALRKYIQNISETNSLQIQRLDPTAEQNQSQNCSKTNSRVETELIKQLRKSPQNHSRNYNQHVLQQPTDRQINISELNQASHQINSSQLTQARLLQVQHPSKMQHVQQQQSKRILPQYGHTSEQMQHPSKMHQDQTQSQKSQRILPQYGHTSEQVQDPSKMHQVQTPPQPSQRLVPQYGHTSKVLPQYKQPTGFPSQCGPTHHMQSSQLQPQSWQSQLGQQQSKHSNHVQTQAAVYQPPHVLPPYGQQQRYQGHNPPPYGQLNHTQRQTSSISNKQQHLLPQYLRSQNVSPRIHPQYGMSNYIPAQLGQTQSGLPQYGQVQSGQPRNTLPQYAQTQPVLPQPDNVVPTGWHQQTNLLQHQTHTPVGGSPRSVSTDSGFISPLNFVPSDQTVPPPSEETGTANLLITHVTSLNPKVAFIEEDMCVVCRKQTKQVCMGCMQCYYCSYDCQLVDWRNHEPNCKMNK